MEHYGAVYNSWIVTDGVRIDHCYESCGVRWIISLTVSVADGILYIGGVRIDHCYAFFVVVDDELE
jgi:hypothetical protein